MSNGCEERSGRESGQELLRGKRNFGGGNGFDRAVAKMAVAQVCESAGYEAFQESALGTLLDVAVRYIHNVGKTARFYAGLAGRTESNAFDVVQGLEDLGSGLGFAGASDIDHCLASSRIIRDIIRYVDKAENIPFAYSICCFPAVKDRRPNPSFLQIGEEPPDEHIPPWLPAFPDPQAYKQLKEGNERLNGGNQRDTKEIDEQKREKEFSSMNFQRNLTGDSLGESSIVDRNEAVKVTQAEESNPFLAAPLSFGEKEATSIAQPTKPSIEATKNVPVHESHVATNHNQVPFLESSAPAIETMKSRLCDSDSRKKKELLKQRPLIQFKIGTRRKSLDAKVDLSFENQDLQKPPSFSGDEDEKDEKKRKAKKILKESIDNMREPNQL